MEKICKHVDTVIWYSVILDIILKKTAVNIPSENIMGHSLKPKKHLLKYWGLNKMAAIYRGHFQVCFR